MKIIWKFFIALGILFFLVCAFSLVPVATPTTDNVVDVSGEVTAIYEGGPFDVVFKLKDDTNHYYINRGLQYYDLELEELKERLIGKETSFKYIKHWSLLNPDGHMRPVAFVKEGEEVIFSRMKNDAHLATYQKSESK